MHWTSLLHFVPAMYAIPLGEGRITMTAERPDPSPADEMLARHEAFAEVLQGERPMKWSDWAMPIYDSQCLTPQGLQVALWAVETLQRFLGSDFLQRAAAVQLLYFLGLWHANDVPWVYANLFQLAAQIELQIKFHSSRWRIVQRTMCQSLQPSDWVHALLQMEVASLGLRAGWQIQFEPPLGTGKQADVLLTNESTKLLVETRSMRISDDERNADAFFFRILWKLQDLAWKYAVQFTGSIGSSLSPEAEISWLQEIEVAVRATVQDGVIRQVPSPMGGRVEVSKGTTMSGVGDLESTPVETDVGSRLIARLNEKNQQAEGAEPVWMRLEEHAGLWQSTLLQEMTLQEKLDSLALYLQEAMASYPNLAGIILSPAVLWASKAPPGVLSARIERNGGIALRCPIPGHRVRESIIV